MLIYISCICIALFLKKKVIFIKKKKEKKDEHFQKERIVKILYQAIKSKKILENFFVTTSGRETSEMFDFCF